ncbi:MAG: hypothetical protein GXO07_04565 [Crenarchaeota archaeon]|nr:hypothetical protein [Thermoproteota archaeon]
MVYVLWPLEDKRLLVLKDSVAVVVGYEHPPKCFVAYVKYVLGSGIWKGYERMVKEYSPTAVVWSRSSFDPNFGTAVPLVCEDEVVDAPDPFQRLEEILSSPKDELEEAVVSLASKFSFDFGVGGSILLGMHHARSDIDLLIYDRKDPLGVFLGLEADPDLAPAPEWVFSVASRTGLSVSAVKELYTKSLRAKYGGRYVSFAFVKRSFVPYGHSASVLLGRFRGTLRFDGNPEVALYYPHVRTAGEFVLESYESAFLRPMVMCDRVRVSGLLYMKPDGTKIIRVGTKEFMGHVLPKPPCRL